MADQRPGRTARDGVTTPTIIVSPARGGTGRWTVPPVPVDVDEPTPDQRAAMRRYVAAKYAVPADTDAVGDFSRPAPTASEETR